MLMLVLNDCDKTAYSEETVFTKCSHIFPTEANNDIAAILSVKMLTKVIWRRPHRVRVGNRNPRLMLFASPRVSTQSGPRSVQLC